MTLDEIQRAVERTREPQEPGVYHVFSVFMSLPSYRRAIKVFRGPKGGYRRPRRYRPNPMPGDPDITSEFYWKPYHVWLTEEEYREYLEATS